MYIIDITGTSMKEKKLKLSISKKRFMEFLIFNSNEERKNCEEYLDLKGVAYHAVLVNYIGLDANDKIEYNRVRNLYVYDKRLRNVLYKFLSAFEESVRAFISNKYSSNIDYVKKLRKSIYEKIKEGSSLSKELENLDLRNLLVISRKLKKEHLVKVFGSSDHLKVNHDALVKLRNTISHHRLLFVYEDFEECNVCGELSDSLINNIKNLQQLLVPYYKDFFKETINNCVNDRKDFNFKTSLPEKAIIVI